MNVLQGHFFSSAFRVQDDEKFDVDPDIVEMRKHLEFFSGQRDGERMYCLAGKNDEPGTTMRVARPAIMDLLADARPSNVAIDDDLGWISTLQRHLNPEDGIVVINRCEDGSEYQTKVDPMVKTIIRRV
jgi:hypothetical protein